jgi:hypothetical protein
MDWGRICPHRACQVGVAIALLAAASCSKKPKPTRHDTEPSAASPARKPAPAPSAAASAADASASPVCRVTHEKVWNRWANRRAGLTMTRLDNGRVAFGVAVEDTPRVLVFTSLGTGELRQVPVRAGSDLSKRIPRNEGRRDLQRVTPAVAPDGSVIAYADYRDKYQNKRRRIACVPASTDTSKLVFDGTPLLEDGQPLAPAAQGADAGVPEEGILTELRDCRTFVDPGGRGVWGIGTQLRGERQPDGTRKWSMRLIADPQDGLPPQKIQQVDFEEPPKKLYTFESPVAQRLKNDSYLLAARYRGALYAWILDSVKQASGQHRVYRGGWPTLPRMLPDDANVLLLTSRKRGKEYSLAYAPIAGGDPKLPKTLQKLAFDGHGSSLAEPTYARARDQRWVSFHAGDRRKGVLKIVPVDEKLAPVGAAHTVSDPEETVYESHLVGLENGELLAVYIQNGAPGADLISRRLQCWVRK